MTETQERQDGLEKRMLRVMEVGVVREFHCRDWCSKGDWHRCRKKSEGAFHASWID